MAKDILKNIYHTKSPKEALEILESEITGLSDKEAKSRLEKYGPNELKEQDKQNPIFIFLKQFNNALIFILFLAAGISLFFGEHIDFWVIIVVIFVNAIIGFVQEYRAEKSIDALKKMLVSLARVYREGELEEINSHDLVPGDVIFLEEGNRVPADARLIEAKNLRTQESSLTGESYPVSKNLEIVRAQKGISDQSNMLWMGTYVVSGEAKAVVTHTGAKTTIGQIAVDISEIKKEKFHFEKKTQALAKMLGIFALGGAVIVFVIGFFIRGFSFQEIFLFTIASLVSAIPEGLPAVVTVVLAIGAYRMVQKKAIIRKLPATETLSVVDTIITDKTGTLTQNTITVEKIYLPGEEEITVSGKGWEPIGNFHQNNEVIVALENHHLGKLVHISALCNNSRLIKQEDKNNEYMVTGDPTEGSLVVLAEKAGIKQEVVREMEERIDDLPFNSDRKYRGSLYTHPRKKRKKELYIVGAPEIVLEKCVQYLDNNKRKKLTQKVKNDIRKKIDEIASEGMRTVALAHKEVVYETEDIHEDNVSELIFVGVVGMKDPLRPEVKEAVAKSQVAGIRVIMATGDHKGTALSIAKEIGIATDERGPYPTVIDGEGLEKLSDRDFENIIKNTSVFARLSPKMKLRIASTLQEQGHVIAMTGDGVNDAAALKKADVGISMGIIGTDAARESSEIVLADDNFASIVSAIEEGRIVFNNTRRVSSFLVTTNFAEDSTIIATLVLGLPLPLIPIQILWLNLVTDPFVGIALAAEPGHSDVLSMPPRKPADNILSKDIIPMLILMVVVMMVATIGIFNYYLPDLEKARTMAFLIMSLTQLFNVFNMRSASKSLFKIGIFSNMYVILGVVLSSLLMFLVLYLPFTKSVFEFSSLSFSEIALVLGISSSVLILGEIYKFIRGKIVKDDYRE